MNKKMTRRFQLIKELGNSQMARVLLVWDRKTSTYGVLKIAKSNDAIARICLQKEKSILEKLSHPMIPRLLESFDDEHAVLLTYAEGITLQEYRDRHGPFSTRQVVCWGIALCEVLSYLHMQQPSIIYRDLKPENIILTKMGTLVLVDFGCARFYKKQNKEDTLCLGTKGFAAPEQYGGMGQSDVRSDLYALGAVLFHLWEMKEDDELLTVLRRCLQYFPWYRYPSSKAVRKDLNKLLRKRKKRIALLIFTVIFLLLAVCLP